MVFYMSEFRPPLIVDIPTNDYLCHAEPEVIVDGAALHGEVRVGFATVIQTSTITQATIGRYSAVEHGAVIGEGVIVGNDVLIGENAEIQPGVIIGDGAVIAPSSVVTQNVDPYTVMDGEPAKATGKRFDQEVCDALLELEWWKYDPARLRSIMQPSPTSSIRILKRHLPHLEVYEEDYSSVCAKGE